MKVFLAGATGALGRRLVPLLISSGNSVVGTTHTASKAEGLRAAGVEAVVLDALKRLDVKRAVESARPDVVIHEMTALSHFKNLRKLDEELALTNRLRTEGTEYLLAAAQAVGAKRFIAQSYTGWPNLRTGGRAKTEEDPLDPNPPQQMRRTLDAIRRLEQLVTGASGISGIILRYGSFYGPGTGLGPEGEMLELIRQRKLPIFGDGAGVWSFIHIDDAAAATLVAIERGAAGIYNIVDDEPAELSVWLPKLADAIGAKPPHHLPRWLGRLIIGETGISMMTRIRGSSNEKAKRALNWQPIYTSWRDGFVHGMTQ